METTGITKSPSLHTPTPTSRFLPLVSYVFLALSAMLALFANRVSWLPHEVSQVAPWAFLCFAGGFAFYRGMLVLAGRYSAFKAFAQILFAGLFFLLLLNSARRTAKNISNFTHADASVRLMAVKLCGYEPQDNCRVALRQALNDPSEDVRNAAASSLQRLGEKP